MDENLRIKLHYAKLHNINAALLDLEGSLKALHVSDELRLRAGVSDEQLLREYSGRRWLEYVHADDMAEAMIFATSKLESVTLRFRGMTGWYLLAITKRISAVSQLWVIAARYDHEREVLADSEDFETAPELLP